MSNYQFAAKGKQISNNIPITIFNDYISQNNVVNTALDRALREIDYLTRDNLRALEWSINEICDNVINHAHSESGGIFQMSIRRKAKEVEFIVTDGGIGVPNSLRSIRHGDWSDSFALEQCIKQGVTRDPQFGQGNGLYGTFEMAALSGGTFHINSGKAHLVYTRGSQIQVRDDELPICGTSVVCAINFGVATLLERALAFKGTGYQMVDHIELQYESREDQATFFLKSEAQSRGSRKSGLEVRRKLSNPTQRK